MVTTVRFDLPLRMGLPGKSISLSDLRILVYVGAFVFGKLVKKVSQTFTKTCDWRAAHRRVLCRARRELSNEYLLAKISLDTASRTSPVKFSRSLAGTTLSSGLF